MENKNKVVDIRLERAKRISNKDLAEKIVNAVFGEIDKNKNKSNKDKK